jgi:hypothetical protein
MAMNKDKLAQTMEFPPAVEQPNVYPLSWHAHTAKLEEIWDAAQRENWDPKKLPWESFDVSRYSWEQREAIAYWWTLLSVFDASAPPVFASAFIKTYEAHEEDAVRRCFFSVTRRAEPRADVRAGDHQVPGASGPHHLRAQDRPGPAPAEERQVAVLQWCALLDRL